MIEITEMDRLRWGHEAEAHAELRRDIAGLIERTRRNHPGMSDSQIRERTLDFFRRLARECVEMGIPGEEAAMSGARQIIDEFLPVEPANP